jgi:signal transduction histidine kinase
MTSSNAQVSPEGEKLTELSHLSSAVGHHVINAFSAIVSSAELIRSHDGDASSRSELDAMATTIVEAALEASQVARRMIDWSRRAAPVGCDQAGQDPHAVDINQLIRDRVEIEKKAAPAPVDWQLNLGSIPSIPGNTTALWSMLGCLLRNALEALPAAAGTVEISTFTDARSALVIAIRDSGCGMTPEVLRRATEPFFGTKADHSGVGLTIAQAVWRRHGGTLSTESQPGQGTAVRLSIGSIAPARPPRPPSTPESQQSQ